MIPTATNTDHVSFTVPSLDQAVHFFIDVIGARLIFEIGPISVDKHGGGGAEDDTNWMYTRHRLHPESILKCALLQLGPNMTLELNEVEAPDQSTTMPRPYDIGASHLAFRVTDIEAAIRYLESHAGVVMYGEPVEYFDGPISGMRFIQFETPWGMVLELDEWPEKMPYQDEVAARWTRFSDSWED